MHTKLRLVVSIIMVATILFSTNSRIRGLADIEPPHTVLQIIPTDKNIDQMIDNKSEGDVFYVNSLSAILNKYGSDYLSTKGIIVSGPSDGKTVKYEEIGTQSISDYDAALILYYTQGTWHTLELTKEQADQVNNLSYSKNNDGFLSTSLKVDQFIKDSTNNIILEYLRDVNETMRENNARMYSDKNSLTASLASTSIVGSYRKTKSYYADFFQFGITNRRLNGKYVTDYLVYKHSSTDTTYNYYTVEARDEITPYSSEVAWCTSQFTSGQNIRYAGDKLLGWSPDKTGINLLSGNTYSFGINASVPASVGLSFGFSWQGSSNVTLETLASRETGYFNGVLRAIRGVSYTPFSFTSACMYQLPKSRVTQSVQFMHYFVSSIYGNGSSPVSSGADWQFLTFPR